MSKKDRLRRKEIEAYKEYKSARESGDGAKTQKAYDHLQKRQIKSIKGDVNVNYDEISSGGLMQTDPMTGMPVAQPGSTPMFPVSAGFVGGSTAKFNPRINQYAQADPLANAAYASQPMPALAQHKRLMKLEKKEIPQHKRVMIMEKEAPKPTMLMRKEIKPLEIKKDTMTYLNQEKNVPSNTLKEIGEKIGGYVLSGATSLLPAAYAASAVIKAKDRLFGSKEKAVDSAKDWATGKDPALKQKQKPTYTTYQDNIYGIGAGAKKSTVVDITDPNWDISDVHKGKSKQTYTGRETYPGEKKYYLAKKKGDWGSGHEPKHKEISKRRYDRITKRWTAKANKQT